jgi:hypothetical protein
LWRVTFFFVESSKSFDYTSEINQVQAAILIVLVFHSTEKALKVRIAQLNPTVFLLVTLIHMLEFTEGHAFFTIFPTMFLEDLDKCPVKGAGIALI